MAERLFIRDLPVPLTLIAGPGGLRSIHFGEGPGIDAPGPVVDQAERELREYFAGRRFAFEVPLDGAGTPFQKRVWNALCNIGYGATASYRDIARAIDCPKGFQAIGQANTRNPLPIIVPCHRIIAADGTIGGYAVDIGIKRQLLDLERKHAPR